MLPTTNGFIQAGDFAHIFGIIFLAVSIIYRKSCYGISAKTQILCFMIYITRYFAELDAITSNYNLVLKYVCITVNLFTCFLIFVPYNHTYQRRIDVFLSEIVIFASIIAAVFNNYGMTPKEIFWAFSQYLDEVVLLPQFFVTIHTKKIPPNVLVYITAIGIYRLLYSLNWIYVYITLDDTNPIGTLSGLAFIILFGLYSVLMYHRGVTIDKETQARDSNVHLVKQITEVTVVAQKDIEKDILMPEKY